MLFTQRFWSGLEDGSVTIAFRRWKRPTVKAGGTLRSPGGVLAIDALDRIAETDITEGDACRAGFTSRDELLDELRARPVGELYRVAFHRVGVDDRIALRRRAELDDDELADLDRRLDRMDARSACGPWTRQVLRMIDERAGVRAGDLADDLGRERLAFKADVRKLKALGLTESLEVGYRLSPRGRTYLAHAAR